MSTVTENDLKDLKDLINQINHNVIELKLGQAEIKTRLEDWKPSIDKITDLSEKVGESKAEGKLGLIAMTTLISSIFTSLVWYFRDRI